MWLKLYIYCWAQFGVPASAPKCPALSMRCALCNALAVFTNNLCNKCLDVLESYLDSQYGCLDGSDFVPEEEDSDLESEESLSILPGENSQSDMELSSHEDDEPPEQFEEKLSSDSNVVNSPKSLPKVLPPKFSKL